MIKYLYMNQSETFAIDINTNEIGLGITYNRYTELDFWLIVVHLGCVHITISNISNRD